jgi:hypothetical protein
MEVMAERQDLLTEISDEIFEVKKSIYDVFHHLNVVKGEIFDFENANLLFRHAKRPSLPEKIPSHDVVVELNDDHAEILKQKRNHVAIQQAEIDQLQEKQAIDMENLNRVREGCRDLDISMLNLTDELNRAEGDIARLQGELHYVDSQIRERKSEVKMMQELKREAERILARVVETSHGIIEDDGGRLDCEKAIVSLQGSIKAVDGELLSIRSDMNKDAADDAAQEEEWRRKVSSYEAVVDWETEERELKAELKRLQIAIRTKSSEVTSAEQKVSNQASIAARVAPILKKWSKSADIENTVVPDDCSVQQLIYDLDQVMRERYGRLKRNEDEILNLLSANGRLETQIGKSRAALERMIAQFQTDEDIAKKEIEDIVLKAKEEEEKLICQIERARLKVGQSLLDKK